MTTKILAIESSCDETSAAVVEDGKTVLSNVVASQIKSHQRFGGVVPELASRHHVEQITYIIEEAMKEENSFSDNACYEYTGRGRQKFLFFDQDRYFISDMPSVFLIATKSVCRTLE